MNQSILKFNMAFLKKITKDIINYIFAIIIVKNVFDIKKIFIDYNINDFNNMPDWIKRKTNRYNYQYLQYGLAFNKNLNKQTIIYLLDSNNNLYLFELCKNDYFITANNNIYSFNYCLLDKFNCVSELPQYIKNLINVKDNNYNCCIFRHNNKNYDLSKNDYLFIFDKDDNLIIINKADTTVNMEIIYNN